MTKPRDIGTDMRDCFISPNVPDSNLEPANLVDTTNRIAVALREMAMALTRIAAAMERTVE